MGGTNAKMIKIGTPKTRNHFFDCMEGKEASKWVTIRKDWTQCPQLWKMEKIILPDHEDPTHKKERPYSAFVFNAMPKSLKQEYFPTRPDIWDEGTMSVEDFKTQYMLQFVDGAGQFLTTAEWNQLIDGDFEWLEHGRHGENYVAGIDFAGSDADNADYTHISIVRIGPNNEKHKVYGEDMHGLSYPEQMRRIARIFGGSSPLFYCKNIFADFTGCGRPVVQTLQEVYGIKQLTGITFGASDTFTNSGMNMKNIMFAQIKNEISYDRFKYPEKDIFLQYAGTDKNSFYHKMIGEWRDLECVNTLTVNKKINAPSGGHDDCTCADALANFAAMNGARRSMPKATTFRTYR